MNEYYLLLIATSLTILFLIVHARNEYKFFSSENDEYYVDIDDIKIDDDTATSLRKMLNDIHNVFKDNNINYWIDAGTLLGAVRHKDLIPWDDDADLCVYEREERFLNLKPILNKYGYDVSKWWGGYKIFSKKGKPIKGFNYKYPFVDIFFVKPNNDKMVYTNKKVAKYWPKSYHNTNDLFPLKEYHINTFKMYGPSNPKPYLDRCYKNWRSIAYKGYDHENEKSVKYVKFLLK